MPGEVDAVGDMVAAAAAEDRMVMDEESGRTVTQAGGEVAGKGSAEAGTTLEVAPISADRC